MSDDKNKPNNSGAQNAGTQETKIPAQQIPPLTKKPFNFAQNNQNGYSMSIKNSEDVAINPINQEKDKHK